MSEVLLKIQSVKKQYNQKKRITYALKGVSLDVYKGEIITLLGVNGAGKSTLSSIIATLHPTTEEDVLFEGTSIYKHLVRYRMQLGFCPQKPNLDATLTLGENLRFSGRLYGMSEESIDKRLEKLVQQFGLKDYLDQKASVLSGGYRQRFMLARSIMHNPKLVLLDEPTVGLDPHIRRQLWALIKELKKDGVTVILTTHYLDEAEHLSDRVCMLDKGLIKLIDTPENLLTDFKKNNLEDVFLALMQETKEAL